MIQRAFVCCGLCHPSLPTLNGNEFAAGLNSRLQELLFIQGSNYDRDAMLLSIATISYDSLAQLVSKIESYIDQYKTVKTMVEAGVSSQVDPRVVFEV